MFENKGIGIFYSGFVLSPNHHLNICMPVLCFCTPQGDRSFAMLVSSPITPCQEGLGVIMLSIGCFVKLGIGCVIKLGIGCIVTLGIGCVIELRIGCIVTSTSVMLSNSS